MRRSIKGTSATLFTVGLVWALSACGGGGGSTASSGSSGTSSSSSGGVAVSPGQPTVSITPRATKNFRFTWADVAGETEYRLLENPDGVSGYTLVASIPAGTTSYDLAVPTLIGRINARYILQACSGANCTSSAAVMVSGTLAQAVGYLKASNTEAGDQFGSGVALSADGNTLAVSALGESSSAAGVGGNQANNSAKAAGAVYVFVKNGGNWTQQAYLKASNPDANDAFGISLALSSDGSTLVVGADGESSDAIGINGNQISNLSAKSGAAYVFVRSGTVWSQQAYLKASDTHASDHFGASLTISSDGNTLAIGAPYEGSNATGINGNQTDNSAYYSGAVYLFVRSGSIWSQQAYVKASNSQAGDQFGYSLALSADGLTLAVGALWEGSGAIGINGNQADNSYPGSGAVYIFVRGSTWSQQAYIKTSNHESAERFGAAVSLSADGNTLVAGAYGDDSNATGINGNQANVGSANSGAVHVFIRSGTAWSQQAYIKASNTQDWDGFGVAVALSANGNTLAVRAGGESSNAVGINGAQTNNSASWSSAIYVFRRQGATWTQQAYVKASNTQGFDHFGQGMSLSGDGNTLVAGSPYESSNAIGINGNQTDLSAPGSGAVYLY